MRDSFILSSSSSASKMSICFLLLCSNSFKPLDILYITLLLLFLEILVKQEELLSLLFGLAEGLFEGSLFLFWVGLFDLELELEFVVLGIELWNLALEFLLEVLDDLVVPLLLVFEFVLQGVDVLVVHRVLVRALRVLERLHRGLVLSLGLLQLTLLLLHLHLQELHLLLQNRWVLLAGDLLHLHFVFIALVGRRSLFQLLTQLLDLTLITLRQLLSVLLVVLLHLIQLFF